jgi:hypothetical protein
LNVRKECPMTLDEIRKFFAENIRYKNWEFHIKQKGETIFLQIQFMAEDHTPKEVIIERQFCRKWQLSTHMSRTELVRTAYKAVRAAEVHELQEKFKFRGVAIYNPHIDVDALYRVADEHDRRKEMIA